MIKNIYSYSDLKNYERASFLIGTEHKKSIMDKIPEFTKNIKWKLTWNFDYFK